MRLEARGRRWRMARPPNAWTPAIGEPVESGLTRELVTPEGVDLRVQLAEASERAAAFLLDAAIIIGSLALFTFLIIMAMAGAAIGVAGGDRNGVGLQVAAIIWLLGFF